ncbi:hypothetical protein ACFV2N_17925 [Streptomyces sp. NPDC059680]|uniref:hypothetical protein n=1 Tax=Streptomyces sp. NPDC059680 TaxID=3346904 RepID=UPI00368A6833
MADMFELMLTLDLRDEFSEEELAELRWHLGAGPKPETLRIVTEFPLVVEDEHGEPVIENHPEPLLASHGEAKWKAPLSRSWSAGRTPVVVPGL